MCSVYSICTEGILVFFYSSRKYKNDISTGYVQLLHSYISLTIIYWFVTNMQDE